MKIRSILAVSDFSAPEDIVVARAARLAQAHDALLALLPVPRPGQRPDAARARAATTAAFLEQRLAGPVAVLPGTFTALEAIADVADRADLVVLPHRRERSLKALLLGQPVLRLLRRSGTTVLVVRCRPALGDARTLVAVDFSAAAKRLVEVAAAVDPRATLHLFHAVDMLGEGHLRAADVSERAIYLYRAQRRRDADQRMQAIVAALPEDRRDVRTAIGRGAAGRQIVRQQEHAQAGLVVVGKRRASAWGDFLLGSVAHDVLRSGHADVLVVPDPHRVRTTHAVPRSDCPARRPAPSRTHDAMRKPALPC